MVIILPIFQHLNEENKNISKAAKCLYMFICHLQRRDSPSVMVTVKHTTRGGGGGKSRGRREWLGVGRKGVWSSDRIAPDLAEFDWDFDKVCPAGGAVSAVEAGSRFAFYSASQEVAPAFSPLGPTIPICLMCVHTQTHMHSHTNTHTLALCRRRRSQPFVKSVRPQRLRFRRRKEQRRGGTIGGALLGPSLSWVTSCRPEVARSPHGVWVKFSRCCDELVRTPGSQISDK